MPPGWGGGTGGRGGVGAGAGQGGGDRRGGGRGGGAKDVQSREELRKFLNFYRRKNSVCVDLYQPAFYSKKPNWEDMAEFVYSVLSIGSTSAPGLIRAAVKDVQLHPVKKLLFLKFIDQNIRDEVAARLQTGLVWPAFDTTVTGWAMDRPVERIRVLGASPETDEAGVRSVLEKYGEIIDVKKGLISHKKLPGCTNGIWTVKLILEKEKTLPPFLIMQEEGEVWQLATGEISVCWKCGQQGHIGDRCLQDVSALAASLVAPTVSQQPSWAHVVSGGGAHAPIPPRPQVPHPPPQPPPTPSVKKMAVPINARVLQLAISSLKIPENRFNDCAGVHKTFIDEFVVDQLKVKAVNASENMKIVDEAAGLNLPVGDGLEHSYALALPPSPTVDVDIAENLIDIEEIEDEVIEKVTVDEEDHSVLYKKAKLSESEASGNTALKQLSSSSPELHHKLPARLREESDITDEGSYEFKDGVHTNMFGVNFVMWFDLSIEGKSAMDPGEEDWGGRLEFGFSDKSFPKEIEDYFLLMEDECTTQSHTCAGRVRSVVFNMRDSVLKPSSYDPRNVVDLLEKYRDAHISDSGWREVDTEEWVT